MTCVQILASICICLISVAHCESEPCYYPCKGLRYQCLEEGEVCDGVKDCVLGDDELNCANGAKEKTTFTPTESSTITSTPVPGYPSPWFSSTTYKPCHGFQCFMSSVDCISSYAVCDGIEDCRGGEDESLCPEQGEFYCEGFWCGDRCTPASDVCDGFLDCSNGSDEENCTSTVTSSTTTGSTTTTTGSTTTTSTTITPSSTTVGSTTTTTDTQQCSSFQCYLENNDCIPVSWVCDGDRDCYGGEDELGCPSLAKSYCTEFWCNRSNRCVPDSYVCDGADDCYLGEDEQNCTSSSGSSCGDHDFECNSGYCIPVSYRCDSYNDCYDGEDEVGCNSTTVTDRPPPSIKISEGGDYPNLTNIDLASLMSGDVDFETLYRILGIDAPQCGEEEFFCPPKLDMDDIENMAAAKCIPAKWKCDKQRDCDGGEDEEDCWHYWLPNIF